jgi:hypothetical protein
MVDYQKAQRFIIRLLESNLDQLKHWYVKGESGFTRHHANYYEEWNKDLTKLHIMNMIHYENGELDKIKMPERRNPPEFYEGL